MIYNEVKSDDFNKLLESGRFIDEWKKYIDKLTPVDLPELSHVYSLFFQKFFIDSFFNDKDAVIKKNVGGFINDTYENELKKLSNYKKIASEIEKGKDYILYFGDDTFISVTFNKDNRWLYIWAMSNGEEKVDKVISLFRGLKIKKKNNVYMMTSGQSGLSLTSIGSIEQPLVKENYTDKQVENFDYIVGQYNSKSEDLNGRLVILSGPPGSGKSFYIKGLINELTENNMVVFLPVKMVDQLDAPSLIPLLLENKYNKGFSRYLFSEDGEQEEDEQKNSLVFIVEDADAILTSREDGDLSIISSMLNFCDGIFGDILDLRIICSTNANRLKFDQALVRNGRLLKAIHIDLVEPQKANEIYKRITNGKEDIIFDKPISLADIYAKSRGQESFQEELDKMQIKTNKMGF